MEETLSIRDILKILKKRIFLIIGIFVIIVGITLGITLYVLPDTYEAQTQILVNQKSTDQQTISLSQSETDIQLIDTYNVIIKSPAILNKVIDDLKMKTSSEMLADQITVSNEENSKVVNIIVEDENAKQAVVLANKIADVFKEEVPNLMNIDNINILSSAKLSDEPKPVKPNKFLNIAMASVASLLLGIGLAFLIEVLDTTIRNETDIEEISEIPIIGVISPFDIEKKGKAWQLQKGAI